MSVHEVAAAVVVAVVKDVDREARNWRNLSSSHDLHRRRSPSPTLAELSLR